MNEEIINRLAAMWGVDPEKLFDAFNECNAVITKHLGDHPVCRTMHVSTLLVASYVAAHREKYGGEAAVAVVLAHAHNVGAIIGPDK